MQTTFRSLPAESPQPLIPLIRDWLRHLRGGRGTKYSQTALPKGGLQRVSVAAGTTVACTRGTLWISDAHGWELVLEAGRARAFDRDEDLLVEALAPALFTVSAADFPA